MTTSAAGRFTPAAAVYTLCAVIRQTRHVPVLLAQVLEVLQPKPGQTIVDCTVGLGGHTAELLARVQPGGRLVGLDMDSDNLALARSKLAPLHGSFELRQANFAALPTILAELGIDRADAVLADLGVASPQIDNPARGFSYRQNGPLDMRMDATRGPPASALLNRLSCSAGRSRPSCGRKNWQPSSAKPGISRSSGPREPSCTRQRGRFRHCG
jgi:16S rRNA (cytosine(1402)-N(4))-methyltransferase